MARISGRVELSLKGAALGFGVARRLCDGGGGLSERGTKHMMMKLPCLVPVRLRVSQVCPSLRSATRFPHTGRVGSEQTLFSRSDVHVPEPNDGFLGIELAQIRLECLTSEQI
jgi:hypothetical protein